MSKYLVAETFVNAIPTNCDFIRLSEMFLAFQKLVKGDDLERLRTLSAAVLAVFHGEPEIRPPIAKMVAYECGLIVSGRKPISNYLSTLVTTLLVAIVYERQYPRLPALGA